MAVLLATLGKPFTFDTMYELYYTYILKTLLGVAVVVYGGSRSSKSDDSLSQPSSNLAPPLIEPKATAPLIGDLLTLLASVIYGLYQVLYKKYVALPLDSPELLSGGLYDRVTPFDDNPLQDMDVPEESEYPPPFGLHPNLLTSIIGLFTCVVLWIPLPILHYFDIEHFLFPTNWVTFFAIAGIACSGVLFNAGFMVCNIVHSSHCTLLYYPADPLGHLGAHNYIRGKSTHYRPCFVLRRSFGWCY